MKVFINWFINCNCCIWFFTMASSAPVSFSPWLWRVSMVSWERADSLSSCSFRGALEVLAHFLSSLCLLFLSLFFHSGQTSPKTAQTAHQIGLVFVLFCVAFHQIWRMQGSAWLGFFNITEGHDVSSPQNRTYFVVEWWGFSVTSCLVMIMILCLFIVILEIFAFPLALGTCHIPSFRYFFSYFLPQLLGMPCL